ncbi:lysozyme inhibitor LprI family protein [Rhizobium laguerreae]|uniref:lysozyme inhibitor LprI family protein n=1 Tax=Rhizobium laguerreae TaxID=1076926 RepID=UPI0021B09D3F|nr:lysozyme inhibitor LprI family protein [Rhizobium laguerreae]
MNRVYKEIEGRLKDDADTTKLLVATQKAWIAFRDASAISKARPSRVAPPIRSSTVRATTA